MNPAPLDKMFLLSAAAAGRNLKFVPLGRLCGSRSCNWEAAQLTDRRSRRALRHSHAEVCMRGLTYGHKLTPGLAREVCSRSVLRVVALDHVVLSDSDAPFNSRAAGKQVLGSVH